LDKISEMAKNGGGGYQDFINYIINTDLFSPNNDVVKTMAEIMLINSRYKAKEVIASFKRYNAFTNRFLIEADKEVFTKEICKSSK